MNRITNRQRRAVGLAKGREVYIVVWTHKTRRQALQSIWDWFKNPGLSFDREDAAAMAAGITMATKKDREIH